MFVWLTRWLRIYSQIYTLKNESLKLCISYASHASNFFAKKLHGGCSNEHIYQVYDSSSILGVVLMHSTYAEFYALYDTKLYVYYLCKVLCVVGKQNFNCVLFKP